MSFCRQRSRALYWPFRFRSFRLKVTVWTISERLNMPIATEPSYRSFFQISASKSIMIGWPCMPRGSWFISITSALHRMFRVKSSRAFMSPEKNRGDAMRHHSDIYEYCSFGVSGHFLSSGGFVLRSI